MAFAINHGVRISYEVTGRGPALVLHHGFSQSSKDWRRAGYVDELASSHTVILVDARGHGASDKPHAKSAYTWPVQVFDVVAVLDELKVSRAAYWGYSMGAEFGFGMAVYAPHRMTALIAGPDRRRRSTDDPSTRRAGIARWPDTESETAPQTMSVAAPL